MLERNTHGKSENLLVVDARLWSRSGHRRPHQAGTIPQLQGDLAEADSVGPGRAELGLGHQQLVLSLQGCGDHVEEDGLAAHRLLENVLGSGGDEEKNEAA